LFYVYDKAKIVKDVKNYEKHFNAVFDGKNVKMIVIQPVRL